MKLYFLLTVSLFSTLLIDCQSLSSSGVSSSTSTISSDSKVVIDPLKDFDYTTSSKIPWIQEGYKNWKWRNEYDINYIEMGDTSKPAIVLIHGFGASSYHWRYNIPVLARDYHVFAFCKLGFGLSSKPVLEEYSADVWRDQTLDFLKEVVKKPATLAGNSIGGLTSLYTAATEEAKPYVQGVVLLNSAGKFRDSTSQGEEQEADESTNSFVDFIKSKFQRFIIDISFVVTKQPARISQVLRQVYPINPENVDSELVESIRYPSLDENASEVFYKVITKNNKGLYVEDLLQRLDNVPLLLCWGEADPWIGPKAADKIMAQYPQHSRRVNIPAGHCPHDEMPDKVNQEIQKFMEETVLI